MKVFFAMIGILASLSANAQLPAGSSLSFKGKASLAQVRSGEVTKSLRLNDRTQAPYSYVNGKILPLINLDTTEEKRTEEEQIAANAYGFVELTKIIVTDVKSLSASEVTELKSYYTQERIDQAKGIITKIEFKFHATK